MKAIKYKFLYFVTYYQITFGRASYIYEIYNHEQRKQIAKQIVNEYLNGF